MLGSSTAYATIPTSDLAQARRFYGEALGLTATDLAEDWIAFRTGSGALIHLYERPSSPAEHTVATFVVDGIEELMAGLRDRGVTFIDYDLPGLTTQDGIFTAPDGFKVAWITDPDGNILSLEQLPNT